MTTPFRHLTQAARIAAKSVVRLQVHGYSEGNTQSILDPRVVLADEWTGSGFFVRWSGQSGFILTNCHVVLNATHMEIQSILTSDELFRVEVVGLVVGMEPDVALLRFCKGEKQRFLRLSSEKRIPCLKLGDSKALRRSEAIRAIGYPLGMNEPNISGGEISNFISGTEETTERLVTDAPINPGNSGGPSIVASGQVIGINTAIAVGAANIGFVTPIHLVKKVIGNLGLHHQAGICQLAATVQKNSLANAKWLKMSRPEGVIVSKTLPNGLASLIGLKTRDVILAINGVRFDRHGNVRGERISRKRNIYDILYEIPLGETVEMKVFRQGQEILLKGNAVRWPGEGFASQPILRERRYLCFGGLVLQDVCVEIINALAALGLDRELAYQQYKVAKSKAMVTRICDDGPALDMDLALGDFLIRVAGRRVRNLASVKRVVESSLRAGMRSILVEFASGSIANFDRQDLLLKPLEVRRFGESPSSGVSAG